MIKLKIKLIALAILAAGCANESASPRLIARSAACSQVSIHWNIKVLNGSVEHPCESPVCSWNDGSFQGTCWPTDEGCESVCSLDDLEVCTAALSATESCEGFRAAHARFCTPSVCGD